MTIRLVSCNSFLEYKLKNCLVADLIFIDGTLDFINVVKFEVLVVMCCDIARNSDDSALNSLISSQK